MLKRFALIGFGEAGAILGADLAAAGCQVTMYDILLRSSHDRERLLDKARRAHVEAAADFERAVQEAQVVIWR